MTQTWTIEKQRAATNATRRLNGFETITGFEGRRNVEQVDLNKTALN